MFVDYLSQLKRQRIRKKLEKQRRLVTRFQQAEKIKLPRDLDYQTVPQLRCEAREKFSTVQPENLGQASRISGITPADITLLMIHLKDRKKNTGNSAQNP